MKIASPRNFIIYGGFPRIEFISQFVLVAYKRRGEFSNYVENTP